MSHIEDEENECNVCYDQMEEPEAGTHPHSYLLDTERSFTLQFACNECARELKSINSDWHHLFSDAEIATVYARRQVLKAARMLHDQGEPVRVNDIDTSIDQRIWRHGNDRVWQVLHELERAGQLRIVDDPLRPWWPQVELTESEVQA